MSPEKRAIRELEAQLAGAAPELKFALTSAIAAYRAIELNKTASDEIRAVCQARLEKDLAELERVKSSGAQ